MLSRAPFGFVEAILYPMSYPGKALRAGRVELNITAFLRRFKEKAADRGRDVWSFQVVSARLRCADQNE